MGENISKTQTKKSVFLGISLGTPKLLTFSALRLGPWYTKGAPSLRLTKDARSLMFMLMAPLVGTLLSFLLSCTKPARTSEIYRDVPLKLV